MTIQTYNPWETSKENLDSNILLPNYEKLKSKIYDSQKQKKSSNVIEDLNNILKTYNKKELSRIDDLININIELVVFFKIKLA